MDLHAFDPPALFIMHMNKAFTVGQKQSQAWVKADHKTTREQAG
jgi:hypothetical protein